MKKLNFSAFIVSVYFWFSLFFISALLFPINLLTWLFTFPFDKRLIVLHRFTCLWSKTILFINPYWRTKISGKERLDPKRTYIIVSNHQSGADILVLFNLFIHFKWVAKNSLFSIPFLGWNMTLNRYIAITRSRGRSRLMMMDKAAAAIREGNSVMIFPEGTRSRDGNLQPFKTGAFKLAIATKCDILPVAIKGTFHAIKKGGFMIHKNHDIHAVILDPVHCETYEGLRPEALAGKVHDLILAELNTP
ncbi:MAG: lysophospholipid acyltransferase family protein [Bacteroidetes bacterium]|nr:lysophospholipid acyltransferase family protein [Bacteroidota bacterium]